MRFPMRRALVVAAWIAFVSFATLAQAVADCEWHDIEEELVSIPARVVEVGPDDSVYAYYAYGIWRSEDLGTNWSLLKQFPDTVSCAGIYVARSGTVFVGISRVGRLFRGEPGAPWIWSQPLEFHCNSCVDPGHNSKMWKMGEDSSGALYVGEYGGAWSDTCAYIYRSTDDGLHWSEVYSSHCRHVHFVRVDPFSDFVYASIGDGPGRQQLVRSDDGGQTWAVIRDEDCLAQPTSCAFPPDWRVFGSDCGGSTLNTICTTADDSLFVTRLVLEGQNDAFVWEMSSDPQGYLYAGTVSKLPGGSTVALYASYDAGVTWCTVRDFGVVPRWRGVTSMSAFDSEGWAYCAHSLADGSYECFRFRHVPGTGIGQEGDPRRVLLSVAVSPNPARGNVTIHLACRRSSDSLEIRVVNVHGECVRVMRHWTLPAGEHNLTWDGCSASGVPVASGVYFVSVIVGSETCAERVVLVR